MKVDAEVNRSDAISSTRDHTYGSPALAIRIIPESVDSFFLR